MDIVERKRPRGAFLNLFDWPGKSRKKLFSSNTSQISEDSKQAKENVPNQSITQHSLFEVDQTVKNSTFNPRSDSSCCASSVTSDDGNVARAPSVVARLMGLECLPLPNVMERPGTDPYFLRSSRQTNTSDHQSDVSLDHLDSRTSKGPRKRMIERFQTETIPPRTAKPISVTHSKLLSPIRNPGFVPSRNPACVMEAASRMIEPSPRMMARTRVVPSSDSSSPVPLRIRDLKEKLEAAAQKASASGPQIFNDNKKTKALGKNSLTTSSSGNKRSQKEKGEAKSRAVKSQNGLKGSSLSAGKKNVLKQNHQKQNCKDNHQQSKKAMNKVANKSLPRSKKPRNGVQEAGIKRGEKLMKCNVSIDDQKSEKDGISFTFSSSMKGLSSQSQGTEQDADSAVKFNVIGGDSLNALLEQKLRGLTSKIESSSLIQEESLKSISSSSLIQEESESVSDCTSFYNNQICQVKEDEHDVSSISTLTEANDVTLSCNKSFSDCRQDSENGMRESSPDQEVTWVSSTVNWEFEYITEILNSSQLMFQDLASGTTTSEVLLPSGLFDEMERSRGAVTSMKMDRKALFDCVNQWLAVKFERMLVGTCKGMMLLLLEHRDLLAEEVNREVKGLKKMREMMIDELVDHDMSCFEGRWVGYEREVFEEGIDIEGDIVSTLVDDLVSDLFSIGFLKRFW
ncbi:uncharacterized protein BNAC04G23470D [Brassica napus]|uniref:DUF4378 domain-containing protein n=2 Tax=Brassica TaxID=3705 RepID=A0A3P6CHW8_BRAOL|nr:uncharacterized protein BNAC04G23470D [Brassica napus]CAF1847802.1 unnamed protein product [Brassica napus]VDD09501.1 unnamed protein product [Brassica oleracea]